MPDYKRKKFRRGFKSKSKKPNVSNDIIMSSSKKERKSVLPENDIKVVRGAKLKRRRRINIVISVFAVLLAVSVLLSVILPVSLFENIVNTFSLIGNGTYPANVSGSAVLNTVSNGSYYYVLSDTNISAYSNNGKKIFSELHGFSNPIISVSETRALVFDQGGKNLYIYNLSGQINSIAAEDEIINAVISRSGKIAVVTHSDRYTSAVNFYDKNCKPIYTWNSAKDIVNNVLLNSSGDKFAISTLNAVSGRYSSKVSVFNFKLVDPLFTLELDSSVVLSLKDTGNGISVVTDNKYKYIGWSKFTTSEISASGEINICRASKKGTLIVFNRANDRSDNTVVLISKKGEKICEFKINGIITDIVYSKNRIYYICDNTVYILDKKGNVLREAPCDYGAVKIEVIGFNSLALINENQILKNNIEKGE